MKMFKKSVALLLSILMVFSVLGAAVTASADEATTVYFVNTDNWPGVNVHCWGGTANTTWPGAAATLVEGTDNVYSYDIGDSTGFLFDYNGDEIKTNDFEAVNGVGKYYEPKTAMFYATVEEAIAAGNGPIATTYTIAGTPELCGSEWNPADTNNDMTDNGDGTFTKVYENVPAGTHKYKVAKNHNWQVSYGNPDGTDFEFTVNKSATVTIRFEEANTYVSHEITGDEAPAPIETKDGTAYFVNTKKWDAVAAHVWNANDADPAANSNGWPGELATVVDAEKGVYSFELVNRTHIVFNNNVAEGALKTVDLKAVDAVGKYYDPETDDFYATAQEAIDAAANVVPAVKTYTVAGTPELCGSEWDEKDENNNMTNNGDGTYTKVYENLGAGTYRFKVVENHNWDTSYGDPNGPEGNFEFTVNVSATVTIKFEEANTFVSYTIEGDVTEPSESTVPTPKEYTIVGYINGVDVGFGDNDWQTVVPEYTFRDGKVTITFEQDSYIFVKTTDNANWYNTAASSEGPSDTFFVGGPEKMKVPAGTVEFTLVENEDGSLTVSYAPAEEPTTESTEPTTESTKPTPKAPSLSSTSRSLKAGQTYKIKVKNTNGAKVTYKTTKKTVATVDSKGNVTALAKGTAKITVKVGKKSLTFTAKVKTDPTATKKVTVKKGKTAYIKITGKASAIKNKYTLTKSGKKIVKVLSNTKASKVKIKGLKKGSTTLTIKVNGVKNCKVKVTVK